MAASIQPYTTARISYLATYLQSLLPGLNNQVATQWITAEKGVNGNVLGTTYNNSSGQHLFTYPSQEAGLQAAASWINTGARYSGVKASLSSGSASAQATALSTSGWNNSYYPGVFRNLIGGSPSPTPTGGASTPVTPSPSQTNPGSTNASSAGHSLYDYLSQAGVTVSPTQTYSSIKDTALTTFTNDKQFQPWMRSGPVLSTLLAQYTGTPLNQIPWNSNAFSGTWNPLQPSGSNPPGYTGASGAISSLIPDVQTAITFLAIILVGIAFIGVGGLIALRKK